MNISTLTSRIQHWNLKKLTRYFALFALIIGLGAFYFWYSQLYLNSERRFWLAIENSMSTPSVVRTLTEGGTGNQVVQDYRFHFAPQRVIENKVVFSERNATTNTLVETEGIVYPDSQYLRYTDFQTQINGQEGSNIDDVLGDWALQSEAANTNDASLNYLSEQVSLAVFGNYSSEFRREFISELKNRDVYGGDMSNALEDKIDGDSVLTYIVSVKLKDYAEMLNRAFVSAGYGDFPPLSPDNYQEGSVVNSQFIVRKRDNALVGVNFGGRSEKYSSYGVIKRIEKPEATISLEELQSKVQQLVQ